MESHAFFKLVCDRDLPDFDAVARRIVEAPPRRRPGVKLLPMAAALAVIVAAGAAMLPRLTAPTPPQTPAVSAPAEEAEPAAPPREETLPEAAEDVVTFNQLPGEAAAPSLDYALSQMLLEQGELWTLAQILDYWGFDPLPDAPEGLSPTFDETSTWTYAAAEGEVWDQFAFTWRERPDDWEGYDPQERSLTVTVATGEILSCGVWIFEEDMAPSEIGGVEMLLGRREVPYGPYTDGPNGEKVPAGYAPLLEGHFTCGGLTFQVTAHNLSEDAFVAVLRSMTD